MTGDGISSFWFPVVITTDKYSVTIPYSEDCATSLKLEHIGKYDTVFSGIHREEILKVWSNHLEYLDDLLEGFEQEEGKSFEEKLKEYNAQAEEEFTSVLKELISLAIDFYKSMTELELEDVVDRFLKFQDNDYPEPLSLHSLLSEKELSQAK